MKVLQAAFGHRLKRKGWARVRKVVAVAVGLGAALALATAARAQLAATPTAPGSAVATSLPPNAIPLNIPGTYTLPPPPAGSNPETMSPAELQAHGLPPMPDK